MQGRFSLISVQIYCRRMNIMMVDWLSGVVPLLNNGQDVQVSDTTIAK